MPTWGVVNQKGGVGKTTTAVNLAAGLAARGVRTLLVDADPQGNATTGVLSERLGEHATLYDLLARVVESPDDVDAREAILSIRPCLDLIPASIDLAGSEALLLSAVGKELILKEALKSLAGSYDWIIIDAPPSLGLLTINILAAADGALVPVQAEYYSLEGLSQLVKTVEMVRRRINPRLEIVRLLLTMVDTRSRLAQQVSQEVRGYFGNKVSQIEIPRNVRLSEAPSFGEPAISRFPSSKGAEAYMRFVDEVMASCGER